MTQLKHSASYWASQNIVLNNGQMGVESDTGATKIGDGITAWNSLTYREQSEEYTTASGTDTYTADMQMPTIQGYYAGMKIRVKFTNANTGASTINLNSFGAKSIKKDVSVNLTAGDIFAGGIYILKYDGTNFQLK